MGSLIGFLFLGLFLTQPVEAVTDFEYEFVVSGTSLEFAFVPITLVPTLTPTPALEPVWPASAQAARFFSFSYRLSGNQELDPDMILALVADEQQVLHVLPAAMVSQDWQTLVLDLEALGLAGAKVPVLYVNQLLSDLVLQIKDMRLTQQSPEAVPPSSKISPPARFMTALQAIREIDGSLTLLLTVTNWQRSGRYQMHCIDSDEGQEKTVVLMEQADFLWPEWSNPWFYPNASGELIFHLPPPACQGQVYLSSDQQHSPVVDILDWTNYATN